MEERRVPVRGSRGHRVLHDEQARREQCDERRHQLGSARRDPDLEAPAGHQDRCADRQREDVLCRRRPEVLPGRTGRSRRHRETGGPGRPRRSGFAEGRRDLWRRELLREAELAQGQGREVSFERAGVLRVGDFAAIHDRAAERVGHGRRRWPHVLLRHGCRSENRARGVVRGQVGGDPGGHLAACHPHGRRGKRQETFRDGGDVLHAAGQGFWHGATHSRRCLGVPRRLKGDRREDSRYRPWRSGRGEAMHLELLEPADVAGALGLHGGRVRQGPQEQRVRGGDEGRGCKDPA
mmetsp:Transcript_22874/g.66048  ORF Transcript_22874/g.66048 Transcript_22874/m.66048 type:complete len:294 (+) Transcript_22874:310-1191(+)